MSNAYEILTDKTKTKGGYIEIQLTEAWWEVVKGNNHGSR
jgi:hypothetical protein